MGKEADSCDRLCPAGDAQGRSIHLQTFALRQKRDRVACMSQQARFIAGQLWQLVRRISGRKRRVGKLVAALKDEDGRVISTPEAAAAMWERKFLEAFSGMGELREVTERGDEGLRGGVALAYLGCPCDCHAWEGRWSRCSSC